MEVVQLKDNPRQSSGNPKDNPARQALTRAVNRAIAEGSPVFVNQPAPKHPVKFSSLQTGDIFDWTASEYPSFFDTCVKTGERSYRSTSTLLQYRVGSIHAICNDLHERDTSVDFA
jgi:hypothetical protein